MSTTLNYTYRYPFESAVMDTPAEPTMRWVTSLDGTSDDLFFDGRLRRPAMIGQCLVRRCGKAATFERPLGNGKAALAGRSPTSLQYAKLVESKKPRTF